jgi:BirA family transcriptional regulator, biotin operon repressor / biotin---[acetyl-CoA-carboxylase] ligase
MTLSAAPESAVAAPGAALRAAFAAPLRPAAIIAGMQAQAVGADATLPAIDPQAVEVETVLTTGSTNADLLAHARIRTPQRMQLRAAIAQTAGRGRLGRRWHAAPGAALLYSLAMPLGQRLAPSAITLVAGVALADCLAARDLDVRLKWPNDLLLGAAPGRKLGGVLAELALDADGRRTLVLGVGINLWLDAAARGSIDQPAAALAERIALDDLAAQREDWLGATAHAVLQAVSDCLLRGFVPYQPRFMRRFAALGAAVEVVEHGARVAEGRALGVDGDGRLLIDRGGRVTAFASGEVSLRTRPAEATATADRCGVSRQRIALAASTRRPCPAPIVRRATRRAIP